MTMVKLSAHPDQIRCYAQGAINGFSTLSTDDAIENALGELRCLIRYLDDLDAAQDAAFVGVAATVEDRRRLEVVSGQPQVAD